MGRPALFSRYSDLKNAVSLLAKCDVVCAEAERRRGWEVDSFSVKTAGGKLYGATKWAGSGGKEALGGGRTQGGKGGYNSLSGECPWGA